MRTKIQENPTPLVVEVIGPGGSGKSSVVRALADSSDGTMLAVKLRAYAHPLAIAFNAARVAIPFLSQYRRIPTRPWYRYNLMIQLESHADLVCGLEGRGGAILFDQGPVYLLSAVQRALSDTGIVDSRRFRDYWNASIAFWSQTMHLAVVLDASNDVLFDRIQLRGSPHPLLGKPRAEAFRKLDRVRESRQRILEAFGAQKTAPAMLKVVTGGMDVQQIAERVRVQVNALQHARAGTSWSAQLHDSSVPVLGSEPGRS